jgi:hypothetical protein
MALMSTDPCFNAFKSAANERPCWKLRRHLLALFSSVTIAGSLPFVHVCDLRVLLSLQVLVGRAEDPLVHILLLRNLETEDQRPHEAKDHVLIAIKYICLPSSDRDLGEERGRTSGRASHADTLLGDVVENRLNAADSDHLLLILLHISL